LTVIKVVSIFHDNDHFNKKYSNLNLTVVFVFYGFFRIKMYTYVCKGVIKTLGYETRATRL
jgi:hypothetical protein